MAKEQEEQRPPSARRRFLTRLGLAGTLGLAATACDQWDEADKLGVTHWNVALPDWPASMPPMTIGFLADLHCDSAGAVARVRRAVAMLQAQQPDVVFLGGDFVTRDHFYWAPQAADALAPLQNTPGGVYGVLGNHDWTDFLWLAAGAEVVTASMEAVGITMLRNRSLPLPHAPGVWVTGLDDVYAQQDDVTEALRGVPMAVCRLLLVHEPDYADMSPPGFAFQFSGHSHGGQIRLPLLPPLHVPKYATHYPEGPAQGPHHPLYTTRGVGTTGPPVRLFCPPEVSLFHLHRGPYSIR